MPKRFFRSGELPLVVLALLSARPASRHTVMSELGRLFGPRYQPSPGSVYPAVEALEAEGLIHSERSASPATYRLTGVGRKALEAREEALASLELRTGVRLSPSDSLEPVFARFKARLAELSGRLDPSALADVLDRAAMEIEGLSGLPNKEKQ